MAPPVKKPKVHDHSRRHGGRSHFIETGFRGFLATCNFREKECVREAYNILNEYANEMYGPENKAATGPTVEDKTVASNGNKSAAADNENEDISDEVEKQALAINNTTGKKETKKRFQSVQTGATNCVFVRSSLSNPTELGLRIVNDIMLKREQKTRYLLRLVPIDIVCRANMEDILRTAANLIPKHFTEKATFAIVFNKRYNNAIARDEIIPQLAKIVTDTNPECEVDLKNAKKSVIVEVIKGLCCLGIATDYMMYKKYNLFEIANLVNDQNVENPEADGAVKTVTNGESDPDSTTGKHITADGVHVIEHQSLTKGESADLNECDGNKSQNDEGDFEGADEGDKLNNTGAEDVKAD